MTAAALRPPEAAFSVMAPAHIDAVLAVEAECYSHPWNRANFTDSIEAGYQAQCLLAPPAGAGLAPTLIGYFVAMPGVQEVHLLNLTVAPAFQRRGWARVQLDALSRWARQQAAQWVWLEVRPSNGRAVAVYETAGFRRVGLRKGYYPTLDGVREDAVVMSLKL